jgi:hypothetical protein
MKRNSKKTLQDARPGDWIRFQNPKETRERHGRVTMKFPTHVVLNCGGPHGTPAVVDERNFKGYGKVIPGATPTKVVLTPWEEDLKKQILQTIKDAEAGGTCGMGLQTIARCLPKIPETIGCPRGTNSWWSICQSIRKIFTTLPGKQQQFLLPEPTR